MQDTASRSVALKSAVRENWVDALRVVATVQMVFGHTLDAVLAEELRNGPIYENWRAWRGTTAISFLMLSGISFYLATLPKLAEHVHSHRAVARRYARGLWLIALGYALHFPVSCWRGEHCLESLAMFIAVDVLQCIGVSLIVLETLVLLLRSKRAVLIAACAILALCWLADLSHVSSAVADWPRGVANYVTHDFGSIFPLIPWAGWIFFGVFVGWLSQDVARTARVRALLFFGLALFMGVVVHALVAEPMLKTQLARSGLVLILCAMFSLWITNDRRLPRWAQFISRNTLTIYAVHIYLVYAQNAGVEALFGHSLRVPKALALATLIFAFSYASAKLLESRHLLAAALRRR